MRKIVALIFCLIVLNVVFDIYSIEATTLADARVESVNVVSVLPPQVAAKMCFYFRNPTFVPVYVKRLIVESYTGAVYLFHGETQNIEIPPQSLMPVCLDLTFNTAAVVGCALKHCIVNVSMTVVYDVKLFNMLSVWSITKHYHSITTFG